LELEPRSDSTNSGRVGIVKGHRYVIEMRSQNIDPVGFVVKLSLLS
jgi:hypothetical protein